MPQQIVIAEQLRIAAVLTDERVDELVVAQGRYQIGDVYLGRVENVLPGIDAAFVNIGESEKNGFIHVTDLGPLRLRKGAAGITELLEPRQKVLVQVMKEPTGTKGPRLTGNLTLPGRFLVLQPQGQGVSISRRISGENERNRLRALGVLIKPPGAGLLVRTEAEGVSEDQLIDDLETLLRQWEGIQEAAETATPPVLLNRDEDFIHRILRDLYGPEVWRVVVDTPAAVARVNAFLGVDQANLLVEHHSDGTDVLEHYRVNAAIRDALKPRVDLPSGGYVIIEPTEALTVIDVNSGSFTRSASSRETVLWTNCEAAAEIARQLKLRNIGGVVIIDFIDMESRRDQLMLLEHFTQSVQDDAARPQIAQLTELGLVELTRKRQGQNIYELFGRACPSCGGLGHVAVLPGKDTLQPLATVTGLVRSAASARAEVPSPNGAEPTTGRRRGGRGGRGGRGAGEAVETAPAATFFPDTQDEAPAAATEPGHGGTATDSSGGINLSRRQDPDLVAVPMDSDQELVYGWMGLSPALLLDPPPTGENLVVRVVRPGEDGDAVLEAARQQLAASGSRRRRRGGRGGSGGESPAPSVRTIGEPPAVRRDDDAQATLVEITPLPEAFGEPDEAPMTTVIETSVMHIPVSQVSSPESRRVGRSQPRTRRQELREDGGGSSVAVAEAPLEAPPAPLLEESESDPSGEPRRRRRRSSASV
ncbi:Rne/Rng family ribonuclease [Synechococcus sp. Cruz-9H2]|uniref:Rne/Rng family ribonuclease n=1 Tax=unclassified Synechococcus TaxID=2626047 RepID=UPI0020CD2BF4|nr:MULTISPECIES: Rne/Rng family ribonuclease [unclassified Synechococcus]MCP9820464.1 Rne/Rng family ribonuclease [Synechococcus sp. Cruz-9H2]MCP9843257.1 Rne/Rng family ribonuclease [Synechococcus sp. Edmonson 11F2]MCP9855002.1 Rne/Rng family ribonuclease [Synechococcus sp. Cruz-9C9]MCP9862527.1 Rne/Rng family ribonuclease [Synechococcus sp. Cruz-7E5]MCP9871436.1 Rne/Rng family ribonuclease [Synechococcus sp. Cruz-7B9]